MLPEIIGKWYTQQPVSDAENMVPIPKIDDKSSDCEDEDMTRLWCYCQEPSFGKMILCDNENCSIKWFHFDCLRIRCPQKIIGIVHRVKNFLTFAELKEPIKEIQKWVNQMRKFNLD